MQGFTGTRNNFALSFLSKYKNLCYKDKNRSYDFMETKFCVSNNKNYELLYFLR